MQIRFEVFVQTSKQTNKLLVGGNANDTAEQLRSESLLTYIDSEHLSGSWIATKLCITANVMMCNTITNRFF